MTTATSTASATAINCTPETPPAPVHGSYTQLCLKAIKDGHNKLHDISLHTGLNYRTVNSIISSLQKQVRVACNNSWEKRQYQCFVIVHEAKRENALHNRTYNSYSTRCLLDRALGMGSLPASPSIKGRFISCGSYSRA